MTALLPDAQFRPASLRRALVRRLVFGQPVVQGKSLMRDTPMSLMWKHAEPAHKEDPEFLGVFLMAKP